MKKLRLAAALFLASSAPSPRAGAEMQARHEGLGPQTIGDVSTSPTETRAALEKGAVLELRLRVPWESVSEYVKRYARWYMPIETRDSTGSWPDSGRRLVTLLSREHGDEYNLVLLFWYEHPYKQDYYCKYARALFSHHEKATSTQADFAKLYEAAAVKLGVTKGLPDTVKELENLAKCRSEGPSPVVSETIRAIDQQLRTLESLSESTWSIGFNACRAAKVDAGKGPTKQVLSAGPSCNSSMIETVVGAPKTEP